MRKQSKYWGLGILLGILLLSTGGAGSEKPTHSLENSRELPPLVLGQGEQRLIQTPDLQRYSLGGPAIRALKMPASLPRSEDSLLIKGIAAGSSDLWIWKTDGSSEHRMVRVEKLSPHELRPEVESGLGHLTQTEILITGSGVVLRGEIHQMREAAQVRALTEAYPKEIHDETEYAETLLDDAQAKLQGWLQKTKYRDDLNIERVGKNVWLRGNLIHPIERQTVEKQARTLFPGVQLEIEALPDNSPTVHFKVYLLELKRDHFHTIGLAWPGSQAGAFRVTTSSIQDMLQLDLALQALEGEGAVKVLSNPELVVRAPGEAELFSGGELPMHEESHFYSNTTWKTFGLTLKLNVTASTRERVRLDIFTEVSRLDPALSTTTNIPGMQSNRMKTQVDARYGSPLLLSGLLQEGTRRQAKGIPLLRSIPILGALFGSEDYLNEKSELVAVLLPSLNPPPAPMEKFSKLAPHGPIPPPRNWVSPEREREMRQAANYPWNALP